MDAGERTRFIGLALVAGDVTLKIDEPADEWREIDRWDGGVGWIAHPEEALQRASHALVVDPDGQEPSGEQDAPDGDVWVIDPVDAVGLDEFLADLGEVAGVTVLIDRHTRDAAEVATRHDVSVWLPEWMDDVEAEIDAPVERFGETLPGSNYRVVPVVDNRFWQEAALFDGSTLVVPEAVGTTPYFLAGGRDLGVHPILRLRPPRNALGGLTPRRLLVGHGEGIDEGAAATLQQALADAWRTAPRAYAGAVKDLLGRS